MSDLEAIEEMLLNMVEGEIEYQPDGTRSEYSHGRLDAYKGILSLIRCYKGYGVALETAAKEETWPWYRRPL